MVELSALLICWVQTVNFALIDNQARINLTIVNDPLGPVMDLKHMSWSYIKGLFLSSKLSYPATHYDKQQNHHLLVT